MNIIDIGIILIILAMGILGLKRGFFKQLVMSVGIVLIIVISFLLKNPLASFLSLRFPFFNLSNIKSVSTIFNILFYQVVSFILIFGLLMIIFNIVLWATNILEKLLKMTIILVIPSKILGFILGVIEGYILVFAFSFLLTQPALKIDVVNESKLLPIVQTNTPAFSHLTKNTTSTIKKIYDLKEIYDKDDTKSYDDFSYKALDIMLDKKIVNTEYVEKLDNNNKLNIKDIEKLLSKYR